MTTKPGIAALGRLDELFAAIANDAANDRARGPVQDPHLEHVLRAVAAIETALDDFRDAAFLVSRSGAIVVMSASARALAAPTLERVQRSLAAAVARGSGDETWEVRQLRGAYAVACLLAILRAPLRAEADDDSVAAAARRWKLTTRQAQVLDLVARGHTNALIAETLAIREGTVEFHLTALFDKVGVCNRATLIAKLHAPRRDEVRCVSVVDGPHWT